jgi:hypothetical protein
VRDASRGESDALRTAETEREVKRNPCVAFTGAILAQHSSRQGRRCELVMEVLWAIVAQTDLTSVAVSKR